MSTHAEAAGLRHRDAVAPADPVPGAEPGPPPVSVAAPGLGVVGAVVALLAGGWLMYAPFAFGYQPSGADWTDATTSTFWTGLGLAVIAVLAMAVLAGGLVAALRARGALAPRRRPAAPQPPEVAAPAPTPTDELTALLRPLVEALGRDNAQQAPPPSSNNRVTGPVDVEEPR
jgi:hypothetical protein